MSDLLNDQLQIVRDMNRAIQSRMGDIERSLSEQETQLEMLKGLYERMGRTQKNTETLSDTIKSVRSAPPVDPTSVAELTKSLSDGGKDFNKGGGGGILSKIGGAFKAVGGAAFAVIGMGLSSLFGLIKGVLKISKFSIQSIFDIGQQLFNLAAISISIVKLLYEKLLAFAQEAFSGGGSEYAQAIHDLKKQYGSLDQGTPKAILQMSRSMGALSKAGLSAFRIFGNKAERIKEFLEEYATKMGTVFDFYAREFAESEGALIATVKGMGLSGEDMEIMGRSAISRGMALADELVETHNATRKATRALGSATKLISRDIAKAMRNVKAFGGSSKESIGKAAAYARSLGLNIDGLTGIAESFHTYDSAVETGEKLLEIFGVRVNAYEMMKEQDVGAMIEHLREGFVNAGVDTTALNKSYLSLLSSTVGLDADVARQLLSYKNVGGDLNNTEDSGLKVAEGIKTLSGALDDLASSIEFKVLSGGQLQGGFISMFLQGLYRAAKMNSYIRPLLRDIVQSLRIVYREGIRTFQAFEQYFPGIHDFLEGIRRFFNPQRFSLLITRVNDTFIKLFKGAKDGSYNFTNFYSDIYAAFMDHLDKFNEIDDGKLFDSLWEMAERTSRIIGAVIAKSGELFAAGITWIASLISGRGSSGLKSIFTNLLSQFNGTFSALGRAAEKTVNKISDSVESFVKSFKDVGVVKNFNFSPQTVLDNVMVFFNSIKASILRFFEKIQSMFIYIYDTVIFVIQVLHDRARFMRYAAIALGVAAGILLGVKGAAYAFAKAGGAFLPKVRPPRVPFAYTRPVQSLGGRKIKAIKAAPTYKPGSFSDSSSVGDYLANRSNFNSFKQLANARLWENTLSSGVKKLSIDLFGAGPAESVSRDGLVALKASDEAARRAGNVINRVASASDVVTHGPGLLKFYEKVLKEGHLRDVHRAFVQQKIKFLKDSISEASAKPASAAAQKAATLYRRMDKALQIDDAVKNATKNVATTKVSVGKNVLKFLGKAAATGGILMLADYGLQKMFTDQKSLNYARLGLQTGLTLWTVLNVAKTTGVFVARFNPIGLAVTGALEGSYLLGADFLEGMTLSGAANVAISDGMTSSQSEDAKDDILDGLQNIDEAFRVLRFDKQKGELLSFSSPLAAELYDKYINEPGFQRLLKLSKEEKKLVLEAAIKYKDEQALQQFSAIPQKIDLGNKGASLLSGIIGSRGDKDQVSIPQIALTPQFKKLMEIKRSYELNQSLEQVIKTRHVDSLGRESTVVEERRSSSPYLKMRQELEKEISNLVPPAEFWLDQLVPIFGADSKGNLTEAGIDFYQNEIKPKWIKNFGDLIDNNYSEYSKFADIVPAVQDAVNLIHEEEIKKLDESRKVDWAVWRTAKDNFDKAIKDYNHFEKFQEMISRSFELILWTLKEEIFTKFVVGVGKINDLIETVNFSSLFIKVEILKDLLKVFDPIINIFPDDVKVHEDTRSGDRAADAVVLIKKLKTKVLSKLEYAIFNAYPFFLQAYNSLISFHDFIFAFDKAATFVYETLQSLKNLRGSLNNLLLDQKDLPVFVEKCAQVSKYFNTGNKTQHINKKPIDSVKAIKLNYLDSVIPPEGALAQITTKLNAALKSLGFVKDLLTLKDQLLKVGSNSDIFNHSKNDAKKEKAEPVVNADPLKNINFDISNLHLIVEKPISFSEDFSHFLEEFFSQGKASSGKLIALKTHSDKNERTLIFIEEYSTRLLNILDKLKGAAFFSLPRMSKRVFSESANTLLKTFRRFLSEVGSELESGFQNWKEKTAEACNVILAKHVDLHDQLQNHGLTSDELSANITIPRDWYFSGAYHPIENTTIEKGDITYKLNYRVKAFGSRLQFEKDVFLRPGPANKSVVRDRLEAIFIAPEKPFGASGYSTTQPAVDVTLSDAAAERIQNEESGMSQEIFSGIDWTFKPNMTFYPIGAADEARLSMP
jgi:hypothetical protein